MEPFCVSILFVRAHPPDFEHVPWPYVKKKLRHYFCILFVICKKMFLEIILVQYLNIIKVIIRFPKRGRGNNFQFWWVDTVIRFEELINNSTQYTQIWMLCFILVRRIQRSSATFDKEWKVQTCLWLGNLPQTFWYV